MQLRTEDMNDSGNSNHHPDRDLHGGSLPAADPSGSAAAAQPCHPAPRPTVAAAVVLADVAFIVGLAATVGYALWALN
jgi:hypothetical protein